MRLLERPDDGDLVTMIDENEVFDLFLRYAFHLVHEPEIHALLRQRIEHVPDPLRIGGMYRPEIDERAVVLKHCRAKFRRSDDKPSLDIRHAFRQIFRSNRLAQ